MELPQQNQHQHVLDPKTSGPNGPNFAISSFSATLQPGNNMKHSVSLFAGCTTTHQEEILEYSSNLQRFWWLGCLHLHFPMVSGINPEIHLDPWRQNTRLDSYGVFTPIVYKIRKLPSPHGTRYTDLHVKKYLQKTSDYTAWSSWVGVKIHPGSLTLGRGDTFWRS